VRNRLARVLLVSTAGFAVAFLFRLLNAPDLMLTQLLVEVLVTIFFALALRRLPVAPSLPGGTPGRWLSRGLAMGAGLLAGSLVLAVGRTEASTHVRDFYRAAAPELAKGLNVVNVILTDFRALDTLMETLVVVLAALGVAGVVRGRERLLRRDLAGAAGDQEAAGLLPRMARLILPLAAVLAVSLLLKGHDEPGGGFVAGLAFAIAAILSTIVALRGRGRMSAGTVALLGAVVLLVSLLGSLLFGAQGLTHAHGVLPLLGAAWKWHTALLFDLGVVLAVAGGVAAATQALWPMSQEERRRAER
jgi:multisubunit Na+/H+ antiporter MnhB subunit